MPRRASRITFTNSFTRRAVSDGIFCSIFQRLRSLDAALFVLQSRYSLPQGQAPVASIAVIGTDPRGSIVATIVSVLLLRVLGAMLLSFLVGACSAVSRSAVPTSLIVSTLVFFNAIQTVLSRDAAVLPLLDRVLKGTPLLMEKSTAVVAMVLFVISLALYCSAIYRPKRRGN